MVLMGAEGADGKMATWDELCVNERGSICALAT